MDMSFANQALSVEYLVQNRGKLPREVFAVPAEIDAQVAQLKLQALGVQIDALTDEQAKYLDSWQEGT
jgi:adenosylhomocysteinase